MYSNIYIYIYALKRSKVYLLPCQNDIFALLPVWCKEKMLITEFSVIPGLRKEAKDHPIMYLEQMTLIIKIIFQLAYKEIQI